MSQRYRIKRDGPPSDPRNVLTDFGHTNGALEAHYNWAVGEAIRLSRRYPGDQFDVVFEGHVSTAVVASARNGVQTVGLPRYTHAGSVAVSQI